MAFLANIKNVTELFDMGGDAVLTVLAEIVNGIGVGAEFTGEQIDRGGELAQQLADKFRAMRGE